MGIFRTMWEVSAILLTAIIIFNYIVIPNQFPDINDTIKDNSITRDVTRTYENSVSTTQVFIGFTKLVSIVLYMIFGLLLYPTIGVLVISGMIDAILTFSAKKTTGR